MSDHAPFLVTASGNVLDLSELQPSPSQGGDDTIPTVVGGLHESRCAKH